MQKKLTINDVKKALRDERFRSTLPAEMEGELKEFLGNPGCACNIPLYRKIMNECQEQLSRYYPGVLLPEKDEDIKKMAENHWIVINCHIDELEKKLSRLGPGRKQLDVARYQDQVTVVVNDLDLIF